MSQSTKFIIEIFFTAKYSFIFLLNFENCQIEYNLIPLQYIKKSCCYQLETITIFKDHK